MHVLLAVVGSSALASACAPASARAQATPAPISLPSSPPASEPARRAPGTAPPSGPYAPGWDVLHYDIELALPEGPGWIAGHTAIRAVRTSPPAEVLPLDLVGLAVQGVAVDGRAARVDLLDGKLRVPTGAGAPGDTVDVDVIYSGTPDDGLVLGRTRLGAPSAFADNWPDRARFWFPAVDHPGDKATVSFTVHAPASWSVVANGTLAGEPTPTPETVGGPLPATTGGRRTWRWLGDVPIPTYTMVVGGTALAVDTVGFAACGRAPAATRSDRCVAVSTWLYPGDRAQAQASFARTPRMLDLFSAWIGAYPYEKLAHVESSTVFGGMENVSAIFYSQDEIGSGANVESTVAHETAHQWFGDSVTESDWHDLWLSEGFATYFAALFYEWADGEAAFQREIDHDRTLYLRSPEVDRPVIDPGVRDLFGLLNHVTYEKGALVLHMLRGLIGDAAFQAGIRDYYASHRNGTAITEDLRAAMEHASGNDLGWFFDQWLYRPGYPELRVAQRWDAAAREVVVDVAQVQRAAWPRFRVPTEVLVRGPWGERRLPAELDGDRTIVRIPAPGPADAAVVDPDGWVLAVVR